MALEMYMVIMQGWERVFGGGHGNVRYLYGPLQEALRSGGPMAPFVFPSISEVRYIASRLHCICAVSDEAV